MKTLMLSLLTLAALLGCKTEKSPDTQPDGARGLDRYFQESGLPSAIMGSVTADGEMQWKAYGPSVWSGSQAVTEDHIFRIFSMTKAIASVAAMQLVEKGLIGLDDPLDGILPEMSAIPILDENGELRKAEKSITLRHLLTHTAGFGYKFTSSRLHTFKPENWVYEDNPRLFEAGTDWNYGTSIYWVGRLIEKLSGQDLETYFRMHITGPLKMNRTWYNVPQELQDQIVSWGARDSTGRIVALERIPKSPVTAYNAGGGLFSSPRDYLTFLKCMLNRGRYPGGELLKTGTFDLMLEDHLPEGVSLRYEVFENDIISATGGFSDEADRWGLAWAIEANTDEPIRPLGAVYWAGAANSYYTLDLENQIAIVYFNQFRPFNDKTAFDFYRLYERYIYNGLIP